MKKSYNEIIYPDVPEQVNYWTKKWDITKAQLNEAILETGSLGVVEIKRYLKRKKHPFSFGSLIHYIRLSI